MDIPNKEHQPGDLILNTYMPDASQEEREEARENLSRLARVLLRIETRLARDWYEKEIREKGASTVDFKGHTASPL